MKLFAVQTAFMENPPSEPQFTSEGLLIPEEYVKVFQTYLDAVYSELDKTDFPTIVTQCYIDGIGPVGGFMAWVEEAVLLIWVMTLKVGRSKQVFYPASVAADIYKVSRDMYASKLLDKADTLKLTIN